MVTLGHRLPSREYFEKNSISARQVQHVRRPGPGIRPPEGGSPRLRGPLLPLGVPPQADVHPELGLSRACPGPGLEAERAHEEAPAAHRERFERVRQGGDRPCTGAGQRARVRRGVQVREDVRMVAGARSALRLLAGVRSAGHRRRLRPLSETTPRERICSMIFVAGGGLTLADGRGDP